MQMTLLNTSVFARALTATVPPSKVLCTLHFKGTHTHTHTHTLTRVLMVCLFKSRVTHACTQRTRTHTHTHTHTCIQDVLYNRFYIPQQTTLRMAVRMQLSHSVLSLLLRFRLSQHAAKHTDCEGSWALSGGHLGPSHTVSRILRMTRAQFDGHFTTCRLHAMLPWQL